MWELGNYGRIAELIVDIGRDLVTAAGIGPGLRVLDVAAGTGNAAIPAARAGAEVTALDNTPRLLDDGRRAAGDLPITWVEGDATALPFPDGRFDAVLSAVGAMFAPDHETTARELARVCRPGGVVALANWTPDGGVGRFFGLLARYTAVPPDGPPPTLWGDPEYVRKLFPGRPVETSERHVEYAFTGTPADLAALYRETFPPVIATRSALDGDRQRAFDRDLVDLLAAELPEDGRWRFPWLLALVRTPGA
jgi:SAM-dependent methyltransferase